MAADLYCTRGDVNALASTGEIEGTARLAANVDAESDTFTLSGHGFETDAPLTVRAVEGGELPSPLTEDETYYAIRVSNAKFQVAATETGAAIDLTTNGVDVMVVKEPPYDAAIEKWSRWADGFLRPTIAVPLSTPLTDEFALVRRLVAELTAYDLFRREGKHSETFAAAKLDAIKSFERIAKGVQLQGDNPGRVNLAVTASSSSASDPRGWGSGCLP